VTGFENLYVFLIEPQACNNGAGDSNAENVNIQTTLLIRKVS
jgi:hypothetical protein